MYTFQSYNYLLSNSFLFYLNTVGYTIILFYIIVCVLDEVKVKEIKKTLTKVKVSLVPSVGLEPTHSCLYWILSPARLPFHHDGDYR